MAAHASLYGCDPGFGVWGFVVLGFWGFVYSRDGLDYLRLLNLLSPEHSLYCIHVFFIQHDPYVLFSSFAPDL